MDVSALGAPDAPARSRAFRRIRRAVLGRRRSLAALCAAAGVTAALHARSGPDLVRVPVLAHDTAAGARLTAADVRVVARDPRTLPTGLLSAPLGHVLAVPGRAGEVLTDDRVVGPALTPDAGQALVAVRVTDPGVVAALVVGEDLDVLAVGSSGDAVEVAHAARVVALPKGGTSGDLPGRLVLLAVPIFERDSLVAHAVRDFLTVSVSR